MYGGVGGRGIGKSKGISLVIIKSSLEIAI
jgi:hypothetical protein